MMPICHTQAGHAQACCHQYHVRKSGMMQCAMMVLQARIKQMLADDRLDKVRKLQPVAGKLGCSLAQLAIAWCAANRNVSSVILGATTVQQVCSQLQSHLHCS